MRATKTALSLVGAATALIGLVVLLSRGAGGPGADTTIEPEPNTIRPAPAAWGGDLPSSSRAAAAGREPLPEAPLPSDDAPGRLDTPVPGVRAYLPGFAPPSEPPSTGRRPDPAGTSRGGAITGRILSPEGVPCDRFRIEVDHPAGEDRRREHVLPAHDGRFHVDSLPPGRYTVRVRLAHEDVPLVEIPGVEAVSGGTRPDARLDPIDLARGILTHRVEVVGLDGRLLPGAELAYRPAGSPAAAFLTPPRSTANPGVIRTGHESVEVVASAIGHSPAYLSNPAHEETVVLVRGIPVRVRLADLAALPDPEFNLVVRLRPSSTVPYHAVDEGLVDAGGEVLLHAAEPGAWKVQAFLRWSRPSSPARRGSRAAFASDELPSFEIRDGPEETVLILEIEPERMRRLEADLRKEL